MPQATELDGRALGPDLARGVMLLFIALANSHYFLRGTPALGGYPQDGSRVDAVLAWLISTFVDGRAFPMFGLLFGYGVAQIVRRQHALGSRGVRRLLWRRSAMLIAVGFVHAIVLYAGDILTAYGVLLAAGAWVVRWKTRWLLLLALAFLIMVSLPDATSSAISADPPDAAMLPPDVGTMVTERPVTSLIVALGGPVGFACPFLVGLWAGRRRILEQPERHRTLLRITAGVGIAAAVIGAQPAALLVAGVTTTPSPDTRQWLGPLHDTTGVFGGFGYAALLSLVAVRLSRGTRHAVVEALAATGQRSMTCYLAQSLVWTVAFTPFLLDLSAALSVSTTALLAAVTWLATVVLADWMRRTQRRGPFETLVRRVTYRRSRRHSHLRHQPADSTTASASISTSASGRAKPGTCSTVIAVGC